MRALLPPGGGPLSCALVAGLLTVPSISVIWSPSSTVTTVAKESEVLSILTTGSGLVAEAGEALRQFAARPRQIEWVPRAAALDIGTHLHMTVRPRLRTRGQDGAKSSTALPRECAIAI